MQPDARTCFEFPRRGAALALAFLRLALTVLAVTCGLRAAHATDLRVLVTGLGSGTITSNPAGIDCGATCDASFATTDSVDLTAMADPGSIFVGWEGDASGAALTTTVTMDADRSVRAVFALATPIAPLADFTPTGIQAYLTSNPSVTNAARFLSALPVEFKRNWILMTRSESLQTGTAKFPRLLLPSANAQQVFTLALSAHVSYPGAHPDAIEYMQWDAAERNFRFHEIVVNDIAAMGGLPARLRGISIDDQKCSKCHSTRNVLNTSSFPGTTGVPPGSVKAKNKPNWDTYDSWAGMTPFNRDRIYQGSLEAAAFRRMLHLWTWRNDAPVRQIVEQLELQPPNVPPQHAITRVSGGASDGAIRFDFDTTTPVVTEPAPVGSAPQISTNYGFDAQPGSGLATPVVREGAFVTLHHSNIPQSDEGRGVRLFDALGGLAGTLNQARVADEVASHRWATGSVPIDVRPVALAITRGVLRIDQAANTVTSTPPHSVDLAFFQSRHGNRTINEVLADTTSRARNLTRRKADLERITLDRSGDVYLSTAVGGAANGLIQEFGAATLAGLDTSLARLRQEVFRRTTTGFGADATVMGGIYVDRELSTNFEKVALYRFFLEPLGVSVDKWSMGVRGRSRTYTFADVFGTYTNAMSGALVDSLTSQPIAGLTNPNDNAQLIAAVNSTLSSAVLPPANAVPTFTDVQRIFNKSCIECHGGLNYPPYANYGTGLDLSEDENAVAGGMSPASPRLARSYANAVMYTTTNPSTSYLFSRITSTSEACPFGVMPCGGPALSSVDVETIRRWILGPPNRPATNGDPHVKTVDGVNYDFQADGEFVFLRDEGLEVQVRQLAIQTAGPLGPNGHTGLSTCVSVNSAVAVRMAGHRVTYQPDASGRPNPEQLELRVDGQRVDLGSKGLVLGGGVRILPTIAPNGIQIEGPGGAMVVVTPGFWSHYQVWYLNIDTRNVRATAGLAGAIGPGQWLPALPDGSWLGPRPSSLQARFDVLYKKFGKAWRVTDASSLFDYAPGTSTATFTLENWPNGASNENCKVPERFGGPVSKPPQPAVSAEVVKRLVREILDPDRRAACEKDILATGEVGFAKTYLWADRIARNEPPKPPVLDSPADNRADLVGPLTLRWTPTSDPEGSAVQYRFHVWPADKLPDPDGGRAVAITDAEKGAKLLSVDVPGLEAGKAYFWKVIAEDAYGLTAESDTRRFELQKHE